MIVVSGALVLVALIFLVIGLLQEGLLMIWLSIGTSVVAGVFLMLGALQRRGAPAPDAEEAGAATDRLEGVTAVSVRPREGDATAATETAGAAAAADGGSGSEGDVAVVPGRPRYHVESCRFLAGRPDVETVAVEQARDDGYTACGVCKPDAALAAAAPAPEAEEEPAAEPAEDTAPEPVDEAPAAPAKRTPAKRTRTAAAAGGATAAATATADAPAETPVKAAKPAKKAAAKSTAGAAQVVVIPDRGKYHVETCRFVRDVPGTVTLGKPAAKRQGYAPCGVCKP